MSLAVSNVFQVVFTKNADIKSHLLRHSLADVFIDNPRYDVIYRTVVASYMP